MFFLSKPLLCYLAIIIYSSFFACTRRKIARNHRHRAKPGPGSPKFMAFTLYRFTGKRRVRVFAGWPSFGVRSSGRLTCAKVTRGYLHARCAPVSRSFTFAEIELTAQPAVEEERGGGSLRVHILAHAETSQDTSGPDPHPIKRHTHIRRACARVLGQVGAL